MTKIAYMSTAAMAVLFGGATVHIYTITGELEAATAKIKTAETNARTAWGKVYDMQEGQDERLEIAENKGALALWDVQRKLDACTVVLDAGKKDKHAGK